MPAVPPVLCSGIATGTMPIPSMAKILVREKLISCACTNSPSDMTAINAANTESVNHEMVKSTLKNTINPVS